MQRNRTTLLAFLGLLLSDLAWFAMCVDPVQAGDQETARNLVSLVGDDEFEKLKEASKLYDSITGNSIFKPIATQATAIIQMRQGNYSGAWKLLSSPSTQLATAPASFRVGHEKLMLWLWLEANTADQAEAQFKRLVIMALNKELPDSDRRDVCSFLGGVIGMLQSAEDATIVSATTLEKGRVSLEGVESKLAVEQFKSSFESAKQQYQAIRSKLESFTQADPKEANEMLALMKQDLERLIGERALLAQEIKQQQSARNEIDDELKKLKKNQKSLITAWNTPTPGKPTQPIRPNRPNRPRTEYETTYTTDSKTGQRTATGQRETTASKRAYTNYLSEMGTYENRLRLYESEVQTYPERLASWTQTDTARRSTLQANKKTVDDTIAAKTPVFEATQATIKEKLSSSKELAKQTQLSESTSKAATIAAKLLESKTSLQAAIARPSHFQLLDFDSEVIRLEKCLREAFKSN